MRPIYKSVVLESAILAVSLSLQAEINDGSDVTTVGVDASTLDGLRVELASPKVSGALDLIASGAAVVSGSTISVTLGGFEELATLEQVTYRLTVKARYGTQVRTLYALDITVPRGTLAGGTQEYEDSFAVVSTFGDGGGEFPDDYARQGDDPNATNTAIYEAMQGLTGLEPDVAAGKIALAAAITAKGVQSSSDETLQQMAVDVQQITQAPVVIDGGEMYAKQLYGVPSNDVTPGYWNLYEVMAQLLSDGRFVNYGGILLAEYYKGYDSLALSGAGAGGGYATSDGAYYTEDVTHYWNDANDGKGNRWVAYLFAAEWHDFDVTNTDTSPRSIHIGRSVGVINFLANGRTSNVVVTDGNELGDFRTGTFTQNFGKMAVFRNLSHTSGTLIYNQPNIETLYVRLNNCTDGVIIGSNNRQIPNTIIFCCDNCQMTTGYIVESPVNEVVPLTTLLMQVRNGSVNITSPSPNSTNVTNLKEMCITDVDDVVLNMRVYNEAYIPSAFRMYVGYSQSNPTGGGFRLAVSQFALSGWGMFQDLKLQSAWNKPLDISLAAGLTEANMYAHILQRLKQDEADCGDGVTITLGQTNLDKLTSAESIALLDDLTNIYGYTFA